MVKEVIVNFRITPELREQLRKETRELGYRTLSALIRDRIIYSEGPDKSGLQELIERLLISFQRIVWMLDQIWLESGNRKETGNDLYFDDLRELIQKAQAILEAIEGSFRNTKK